LLLVIKTGPDAPIGSRPLSRLNPKEIQLNRPFLDLERSLVNRNSGRARTGITVALGHCQPRYTTRVCWRRIRMIAMAKDKRSPAMAIARIAIFASAVACFEIQPPVF